MKLVDDLLLSTATDKRYSPPVSLGDANSAMFELWITSASNIATSNGVKGILEGSNDGINWTDVGLDSTAGGNWDTTVVPAYKAVVDTTLVVPYALVRIRFEITASSGTGIALVSASIRPWRSQ